MNVDLPNLGSLGIGQLQQYLQGVNLPAQKEEVASSAESNGAPQNVVDGIRNAAQNQFNSQDGGRGHGRDRGRATVFGGPGDAGLEDGWMAVRGRPNVHRRWAIPPWHPEVWGDTRKLDPREPARERSYLVIVPRTCK
jgi:hypothetical protein